MYYQGKYPETPEGKTLESFHLTIRKWVRRSEKPEPVSQVLAGKSYQEVADENDMTGNMRRPPHSFFILRQPLLYFNSLRLFH